MATEATRQLWRQRVEAWQRSGLTQREFGARHEINPATLSWWKWRLNQERDTSALADRHDVPAPIVKVDFVELDTPHRVLDHQHGDHAPIELVIDDEHCVRLPMSFDANALHRLLDVLEVRR